MRTSIMSECLKNAMQITHQCLDPLRPLSGVDPLLDPFLTPKTPPFTLLGHLLPRFP